MIGVKKSIRIKSRTIKIRDDLEIYIPSRKRKVNVAPRISVDGRDVYIHRFLMEMKIGRRLRRDEVVHHIDENPHNYDLSNLVLLSVPDHAIYHHRGRKKGTPAVNRTPEDVVRRIVLLSKKGMNYSEISRMVGVSDETVRRYVRTREGLY